jgi:hypothetical protein
LRKFELTDALKIISYLVNLAEKTLDKTEIAARTAETATKTNLGLLLIVHACTSFPPPQAGSRFA